MDTTEQQKLLGLLNEAFSPSSPILSRDYFSGRNQEIDNVVDSINERGQHVIVHGDRGVGKTSFANVIANELINVFPVKITCNRNDSFKELWKKSLAKVQFEQTQYGIGFLPTVKREIQQLDQLVSDSTEDISSLDVQYILEKVDSNLLFIFDEYDAIAENDVKSRMADTIKALSDNAPRVTIMLVGIAEDVTSLIGAHPSIERCTRQVHLPRMSDLELQAIIDRGLNHLQFNMDPAVRGKIVHLSLGFPHFTHLLAKQACRAAIDEGIQRVSLKQYYRSLAASVSRVDESTRATYQRATFSSNHKSNFEAVLWSCAQAPLDAHGTFRTRDVVEAFAAITERETSSEALSYNLSKLCTTERGAVIERLRGGKHIRYRFRNPLFRTYIRLYYESISKTSEIRKVSAN